MSNAELGTSHGLVYLILAASYCDPHFIEEKTDSERLSNLSKAHTTKDYWSQDISVLYIGALEYFI